MSPRGRTLLSIPLPPDVQARWESWFVPDVQPFLLSDALAARLPHLAPWKRHELHTHHMPLSVIDTFGLYASPPDATWTVQLDESGWHTLSEDLQQEVLREQRSFRRGRVTEDPCTGLLHNEWPLTWWARTPQDRWQRLQAFVEDDRLPCRRQELTDSQRQALRQHFPALEALMGTFAADSGPNCLGTVMAACGVTGVARVWMHGPPFQRWLDARTRPADDLSGHGTILVWRDADGAVQHAALSLGDGWVFHKESQAWFAPRQVADLNEVLVRWAEVGWTTTGYLLRPT
ncbi:hypothetical protein [Deinococcus aquiradiocola]|uniref:Uncharacterized protein n=1 Tax=Deinococcus aquiradiocola TaxID=393059 RepID=A0A917PLY0_9DEIO|nr:hypothetical protein [Deinococcus aquiradiocola]GGJ84046.1 hypothetical protein GCM10008939_29900 [Deinococcus aquiradiocola]